MRCQPRGVLSLTDPRDHVAGTERRVRPELEPDPLRVGSVLAQMPGRRARATVEAMRYFLVEIPMRDADQVSLRRATRTLLMAQSRLRQGTAVARTLLAGVVAAEGRLLCVIEAPQTDAVRTLIALALLPAARIREITHPAAVRWPRGPVRPRRRARRPPSPWS
jgi:hypothetical protein